MPLPRHCRHTLALFLPPIPGRRPCFPTTEAPSPPRNPPTPPNMPPLPLTGLQHVSLCVRDPDASTAFYRDVLGFAEVKRPTCLEESFDGSW